ncbi:putative fatty-acid-CoA ligase FadD [Streptomyces alanosinicus]|uniref:Fatty-acid-CoA ligase FadD n=2 Tax=Streptomyces alanosinicus TaxID=68171 RepID=A0A919D6R2_9ACTN|nr:putative fatty-acid-CoA ligase FadD [Streptomyces alanosinicus]
MFERAAARHPHAPVVLDTPLQLAPEDGTRLTLRQVALHVRTLSARLKSAGVRAGDRVAVHKTNNFDIALLAAAVQRIGAVPALLSPRLDGETVSRLLERLGRPWLLSDADKLRDSGIDLSAARRVLLSAGEELPGTELLTRHAAAPVPAPTVPGRREPAFISHTSGTTGLPKLVVQTPDALWHRVRLQKLVASRIYATESVALCMSFVHARFYTAVELAVAHGNPLLVMVDEDPATAGALFAEYRPGIVETQPNTFVDWEVLAGAPGAPLGNVRIFAATFDAMHPRTVQTLLGASRRRKPRFIQLYGQTETGPVAGQSVTLRSAARAAGRSVGWPLPGVIRMRITDAAGRPVKRGVEGHVEVRSRTRAVTYLGEDERFRGQLNHGWWRMGDLGHRDALGRLHLLDREIDHIASVGSSLELEDRLMERLPELREVVIIAGDDGVAVPVVCTRDDEPLPRERWERATADLPALAPMRHLPYAALPHTATAKVRRPELIRLLAEGVHG